MKLFGHPESGHAFKVRFHLAFHGIAHRYETVDIFKPRARRQPEFMTHATYGEVPLLLDDNLALTQSNAILLYLDAQNDGPARPEATGAARVREWLFWEANKLGMCLPQLRSYHRFDDHGISDGACTWLQARYSHDVGVMEAALADGRDWIANTETPSAADFSLCGYLFFADEAKVTVPERVSRWLARLSALPGWQHPYTLMADDSDAGPLS